jgi:hypothetical protein
MAAFDLEQIPLADPNFDPTSVPFVRDIVDGKLAGVTVSEEEAYSPAFAPLVENGRALFTKAGLVMAPTSLGAAIFNPDVIKLSEIEAIDKAGTLSDILPPLSKYGSAADVPQPPSELPRPPISIAPSAPPAAGIQRQMTAGRLQAQAALPVTRTPSPTGGTLLNQIRRPVI